MLLLFGIAGDRVNARLSALFGQCWGETARHTNPTSAEAANLAAIGILLPAPILTASILTASILTASIHVFDLLRPAAKGLLRERCGHELIEVAIKHAACVRRRNTGAKVLHHLIRLQHI